MAPWGAKRLRAPQSPPLHRGPHARSPDQAGRAGPRTLRPFAWSWRRTAWRPSRRPQPPGPLRLPTEASTRRRRAFAGRCGLARGLPPVRRRRARKDLPPPLPGRGGRGRACGHGHSRSPCRSNDRKSARPRRPARRRGRGRTPSSSTARRANRFRPFPDRSATTRPERRSPQRSRRKRKAGS